MANSLRDNYATTSTTSYYNPVRRISAHELASSSSYTPIKKSVKVPQPQKPSQHPHLHLPLHLLHIYQKMYQFLKEKMI